MSHEKNPIEEFRQEVSAFLAETAMPESKLGSLACSDPNFVADLNAGREPRFSTMERVRSVMREQREKRRATKCSDANKVNASA